MLIMDADYDAVYDADTDYAATNAPAANASVTDTSSLFTTSFFPSFLLRT